MNTYLLPICFDEDNIIHKVIAKDYKSAEDKYIKFLSKKYIKNDNVDPEDIYELKDILLFESNVIIGDIYSLDEFE